MDSDGIESNPRPEHASWNSARDACEIPMQSMRRAREKQRRRRSVSGRVDLAGRIASGIASRVVSKRSQGGPQQLCIAP